MVMELYDENRLPTTNLATTIHGFDWWNPRSTFLDGAVAASAEEYNDATARLWKKEDLNSRVQIVSEASVQKSSRYDLNTFRTNSIYPIGRTDSGHGLIRWVVHMEFLDTNNATSIADMHNTLAAYATAYDFNAYSDNNVLAPTASEWWYATQYNKGTADANQVFAKGYSGDRALRFYNRMWNPTSASMWDACAGLNGARGMAGWTDSDLNPEFAAGEMEYLNYVIFLADTNWLTNIDYPLKKSLADENRIDYVMQDWRNPDEPFMNAGTYNIATSNNSFDFNVGVYDLNAAVQADLNVLVDFNLDTRGTKNTYNNFYSDMNTMDTNRYRPAFRVNGYTFATQPVVKINSQLGVYDVNYICDVNTTGNYLVCIWYGDLTNPDQNVQIQIASNFPTTGGGSTTHDCDKPPASGTWLIDDGFYCIKYATQIVYAGDVNIFSGGLTFTNNTWLDINSGFTIYRYDNNGLNFFGSIYGSGIK